MYLGLEEHAAETGQGQVAQAGKGICVVDDRIGIDEPALVYFPSGVFAFEVAGYKGRFQTKHGQHGRRFKDRHTRLRLAFFGRRPIQLYGRAGT